MNTNTCGTSALKQTPVSLSRTADAVRAEFLLTALSLTQAADLIALLHALLGAQPIAMLAEHPAAPAFSPSPETLFAIDRNGRSLKRGVGSTFLALLDEIPTDTLLESFLALAPQGVTFRFAVQPPTVPSEISLNALLEGFDHSGLEAALAYDDVPTLLLQCPAENADELETWLRRELEL